MLMSKTRSSSSMPLLALIIHTLLLASTFIPGVATFAAAQQPQQQQLLETGISDNNNNNKAAPALASLSALLDPKARPTPKVPVPSVSICCGDSCCPSCCDQYRVVPTDLAYAYPEPTPVASGQDGPPPLNTQRPCCTLGCADGACRLPQSTLSHRPEITTAPLRPSSGRTKGTMITPKATNTANVVIGCCSTCVDCDQTVALLQHKSSTAASWANSAQAKATGAAGNTKEDPDEKSVLFAGEAAVCIGCGGCSPCDQALVLSYVSFEPQPSETPGDDDPAADVASNAAAAAAAAAAAKDVVIEDKQRSSPKPTAGASCSSSPDHPEPTYYLGEEINEAINGQNQEIVPLIIRSGGVPSTSEDKNAELITLLATIDLKLQENYISRRMLSQLALGDKVQNFPRGLPPQVAFLSFHQDKSIVNASMVLDLVTGNAAAGTQAHFRNVRFFVFGAAPTTEEKNAKVTTTNQGVLRIPDVIIGDKFLREVGGLSVFPGFKTQVEKGVKIVYPVHRGRLGRAEFIEENNEQGNNNEEHDEL